MFKQNVIHHGPQEVKKAYSTGLLLAGLNLQYTVYDRI